MIIFSHLDNDRYPFFSSKRGYFERWMAERKINSDLASRVKGSLQQMVRDFESLKEEVERNHDHKELQEVKDIVKAAGIDTSRRWAWKSDLESRLKNGMPHDVESALDSIGHSLQQARDAVQKMGAATNQQTGKEVKDP